VILDVVKVLVPAIITFAIGIAIAPILARFLYKHKMWKKTARNDGLGDKNGTPIFNKLHKEREVSTPRMGGIIIWASVLFAIFLIWFVSLMFPSDISEKFNFLSRNQTWLPFFTLIAASLVGLIDDILQVRGKGGYVAGGLSLWKRILVVLSIGAVGGWWFYFKLDTSSIAIPFDGFLDIGWLFIPFFMLVMLALFSSGIIDGIDGLSGGVMASIFAAYAGIAFFNNQIDLAAFSAALVGGILAFLWFNIPPARFYMSETGMLGLTTTLTVVAFLTKEVFLLPLIAFPLTITTLSDILQICSKKWRGKKIFLIAPIHHHFEAKGWPPYKVTMRYWVISVIFAVFGMIIALIS